MAFFARVLAAGITDWAGLGDDKFRRLAIAEYTKHFSPYDVAQITKGIDRYLCVGKKWPTPADILEKIDRPQSGRRAFRDEDDGARPVHSPEEVAKVRELVDRFLKRGTHAVRPVVEDGGPDEPLERPFTPAEIESAKRLMKSKRDVA